MTTCKKDFLFFHKDRITKNITLKITQKTALKFTQRITQKITQNLRLPLKNLCNFH